MITKMAKLVVLHVFAVIALVYAIPRPSTNKEAVLPNTKHAHTVPTYFRRQDQDGHLINRDSSEYGKEINLPIIEEISPSDQQNAALKVKPYIIENGDIVSVFWSGVAKPNAKDWIALLCPHTDKVKKQLDHFFVDESPTWYKGYGTHKVHLFNMREDCEFRYFRNGRDSSKLVARSNKVGFKFGADAPLQGRIALTGDPSEMRVMWTAAKCKIIKTVSKKYSFKAFILKRF